jgi:hypothetical protein
MDPGSGAEAGAPTEIAKLLGSVNVWLESRFRESTPVNAKLPVIGANVFRSGPLKSPALKENAWLATGTPKVLIANVPVPLEVPLRLPSSETASNCVGSKPVPWIENVKIWPEQLVSLRQVNEVFVTSAVEPLNFVCSDENEYSGLAVYDAVKLVMVAADADNEQRNTQPRACANRSVDRFKVPPERTSIGRHSRVRSKRTADRDHL